MTLNINKLFGSPEDEIRWAVFFSQGSGFNYTALLPAVRPGLSKGCASERIIVSSGDEDIAAAGYSLKKSGFVSVADIKSGITFKSSPDPEVFGKVLENYISWSAEKGASFARINTWLPRSVGRVEAEHSAEIEKLMKERGFVEMAKPKFTYWIDLLKTEDEILAGMKRQTRYDVRQGEKLGLTVEYLQEPDNAVLEEFGRFYTDLGARKGFGTKSHESFTGELDFLLKEKLALIFIVKFRGQVVNMSVAAYRGRGQYLYGAVNPGFKSIEGCPSPGPTAQWEMIKEMKRRGLAVYDMGFCPGAIPLQGHPKYQIWRFKYGFGGTPVEFQPVYGKILKAFGGRLFYFIKKQK